jgi:hypothetical protein
MAATLGRALPPLMPAWLVLWVAERARWHTHLATLALTCTAVLVVYLTAAWWITFDGDERTALAARLRHR